MSFMFSSPQLHNKVRERGNMTQPTTMTAEEIYDKIDSINEQEGNYNKKDIKELNELFIPLSLLQQRKAEIEKEIKYELKLCGQNKTIYIAKLEAVLNFITEFEKEVK